ncbi:Predicted branched-chain amino acid permease (azaleucine resistance) [Pseudomonas saponiphila]|uniref:Predicted branched-chain amino acid permease (Azaleucine resistance) n=1 Tax=Pseudomonas saponiphila TaxID=556534 RepID=A0A1H4NYC0_9PSED|nr:AzlC family ABC transporter permease [Pseudomonas saponiphila]SEC00149.1 Predicted branched-chain amino acid permease (azaleucine resistance) [Pseudomonas saponiphila]
MQQQPQPDSFTGRPDLWRRVTPTALAIVPVSMLFGVLAARADWSLLEVALVGLLGFTGSGQFAALPLAQSGAGFFTLLLVSASLNSRYLPMAFASSARLPRRWLTKAAAAHLLGDEAYATETHGDSPAAVLTIRATIFLTWVLSGVLGACLGRALPAQWVSSELNLGYPASVVLMYLALSQLRRRLALLPGRRLAILLRLTLCVTLSLVLIRLLGTLYFWIPSVLATSVILAWNRS